MSTRSRWFRFGRVTVPAVALTLLLGACDSDGQAAAPTVTVTSTVGSSVAVSSAPPTTAESASAESSTGSSSQGSSTQESSAPVSSTETSSTVESSTQESSTPEPSTDTLTERPSSAPVTSTAPTKPGTKLKFGQQAVFEYQTGEKGNKDYRHGFMATTVTKIVKLGPRELGKLDNKNEFPLSEFYYVFSEAKILFSDGAKNSKPPIQIILHGLRENGSDAGTEFSLQPFAGCAETSFDSPAAGTTATKCSVMLVQRGSPPVVAAGYQGDRDSRDNADNPFRNNPVVWGP